MPSNYFHKFLSFKINGKLTEGKNFLLDISEQQTWNIWNDGRLCYTLDGLASPDLEIKIDQASHSLTVSSEQTKLHVGFTMATELRGDFIGCLLGWYHQTAIIPNDSLGELSFRAPNIIARSDINSDIRAGLKNPFSQFTYDRAQSNPYTNPFQVAFQSDLKTLHAAAHNDADHRQYYSGTILKPEKKKSKSFRPPSSTLLTSIPAKRIMPDINDAQQKEYDEQREKESKSKIQKQNTSSLHGQPEFNRRISLPISSLKLRKKETHSSRVTITAQKMSLPTSGLRSSQSAIEESVKSNKSAAANPRRLISAFSDSDVEMSDAETEALEKPKPIFNKKLLSSSPPSSTASTNGTLKKSRHTASDGNSSKTVGVSNQQDELDTDKTASESPVSTEPVSIFTPSSRPSLGIVIDGHIVASTPTTSIVKAKVRPRQAKESIDWFKELQNRFTDTFRFEFKNAKAMEVGPYDVARLNASEFLNDTIINFYLKFFLDRHEELKDRAHVFSTFFYEKLIQKNEYGKQAGFEQVRRWTSKVDLFSREFIVIPIHMKMHWYGVIVYNLPALLKPLPETEETSVEVDPFEPEKSPSPVLAPPTVRVLRSRDKPIFTSSSSRRRTIPVFHPETDCYIFICDSLKSSSYGPLVKNLKEYFVAEAKDKLDITIDPSRIISRSAPVPQQNNFSDCGVFLIHYIESFFNSPDKWAELMALHTSAADSQITQAWKPSVMKRQILQRMLVYYRSIQEKGPNVGKSTEELESILKASSDAVDKASAAAEEAASLEEKEVAVSESKSSINNPYKDPSLPADKEERLLAKGHRALESLRNSASPHPVEEENNDSQSAKMEDFFSTAIDDALNNDVKESKVPLKKTKSRQSLASGSAAHAQTTGSSCTRKAKEPVGDAMYISSSDEDVEMKDVDSSQTENAVSADTSRRRKTSKSNRLSSSGSQTKERVTRSHSVSLKSASSISEESKSDSNGVVAIEDEAGEESQTAASKTQFFQTGKKSKHEFEQTVAETFSKIKHSSTQSAASTATNDQPNELDRLQSLLKSPSTRRKAAKEAKVKAQTNPLHPEHGVDDDSHDAAARPRSYTSTSGAKFKDPHQRAPITTSSAIPKADSAPTLRPTILAARRAAKKNQPPPSSKKASSKTAVDENDDGEESDGIEIVDCQKSKGSRRKRHG